MEIRLILELGVFWIISVYFLYQVSKHLKLGKQDKRTAVSAGIAAICLGVLVIYLFPGGVRFFALVSYLVLIQVFYGCSWSQCFDVLTRTVFFSLLCSLPVVLIIEWLMV